MTENDAWADLSVEILDSAIFKFGLSFKSDETMCERFMLLNLIIKDYSMEIVSLIEVFHERICFVYYWEFLKVSAAFRRNLQDTFRA